MFNKMETIVKTHNAIAIIGTTSANADQSSARTQLATILYSATMVKAVNDSPSAIANR